MNDATIAVATPPAQRAPAAPKARAPKSAAPAVTGKPAVKARKAPAKAASKTATKVPTKVPMKAPTQASEKAPAKVTTKTAVKAPVKRVARTAVKAATPVAAKPAAKVSAKAVAPKPAKIKLMRDSFTMPSDEYAAFGELKQRALHAAHPIKKSELLRAGIKLLAGLSDAALLQALKNVPAIKTGRPKAKKGE